MKISNILISLIFINSLSAIAYKLVIVDNGYNFDEDSIEKPKKYMAALFYSINYTDPTFAKDVVMPQIVDSKNWKLVSYKEINLNPGLLSNISEQPLKSIKYDLNILENKHKFTSKMNEDENKKKTANDIKSNTLFLFYNLTYENQLNQGFNLMMKKTEFYFFRNCYFMEDFNGLDQKPENTILDFSASFSSSNLNFIVKISQTSQKQPVNLIQNTPFFSHTSNLNDSEESEEIENKPLKINLYPSSDNSYLDLFITFNDKEYNFPSAFSSDPNSPEIEIYCDYILDGFKRRFEKIIFNFLKDKISGIENLCFNKFSIYGIKPFNRVLNYSNVVTIPFILDGKNKLRLSIIADSKRTGDIEERILI